MPRRLEKLNKSGMKKLSRTDEDARFLRQRGDKFVLGYSAEIAVSDDHLIVAQRVTRNAADNASLAPLWTRWNDVAGRGRGRSWPIADSFSIDNLEQMERRNINAPEPGHEVPHPGPGPRASPHAGQVASPDGQAAYDFPITARGFSSFGESEMPLKAGLDFHGLRPYIRESRRWLTPSLHAASIRLPVSLNPAKLSIFSRTAGAVSATASLILDDLAAP